MATARDAGADRLLLEVREDNTGALAFYAARGFVEVDRRARYYRDGTTAVVLRRGERMWQHVDTPKLTMRDFYDAFSDD